MTPARFEAHVSRGKTLLFVLGSLGFVAAGVPMVRAPSARTLSLIHAVPVPANLFGWLMIAFFGLAALAWAGQLVRTEPVIRIGTEGVRWSRWSDSVIPWAAIERAQVESIRRQRFLTLWLRDPAAYRSTSLSGRMRAANRAFGFGDIPLSATGTDRSFDELVDAVRAHAPQLFRR